MTTVNVSEETRVRLTNSKTSELKSVDRVILDLYDRAEGNTPDTMLKVAQPAQTISAEQAAEDAKLESIIQMNGTEKELKT